MKKVFEFKNYKDFALSRIQSMPRKGRGEYSKIARHLGMHSTVISQVFRGSKNLTAEQACGLSKYFGLTERETDYFLALVLLARAGNQELKAVIRRQLADIREQASRITNRVKIDQVMNEEIKTVFYSSWHYSAIRSISDIPDYQSIDSIADYFNLSRERVSQVVGFLLASGLCVEKANAIQMGSKVIHLEVSSPLVPRHHTDFRLKAIDHFEHLSKSHEMAYTGLLSLSRRDVLRIREVLLEVIAQTVTSIRDSESEVLYCLNMDWFNLK